MPEMRVIRATYGGADCTRELQSRAAGGRLVVWADNSIVGDPAVGVRKTLDTEIEHAGEVHRDSTPEGSVLVFPKSGHRRLGVFYSNNQDDAVAPFVRSSLESIRRAAEGRADVLTSVWRRVPENPFAEFVSWTQTSSHLNQLLQIMQLLYQARLVGDYEYVSFLEHDVLYPEGYFDYPEFGEGFVLTNMNYMGVNAEGFQPLGQRDEPFHQMTMRFADAVSHCESILENAILRNSGLIEPQGLRRMQWMCPNPSVHMNHGRHFTSHYNVYTKQYFQHEPYWGSHSEVWPSQTVTSPG